MSSIGGKKRESSGNNENYTKKVGLFEAKVIAINPSLEEYKDKLGIELKEDSKAVEYLGESRDGNTYLRLDFWLEEVKNKDRFKVSFFLENKEKENKDGTKKQFINSIGNCSWGASESDLADWFTKRDYRVAHLGEEELYEFMRVWLGNLDYRDLETTLELEWKKLMKGNVKDIKEQIDGEWSVNIVALATIVTRENDGEVKEYQSIYNKAFLPAYTLKQFRLVDYSNNTLVSSLKNKANKDLKAHERFVVKVSGEYGCKDYYTFREIEDYVSIDNIAASNKNIDEDDSDY